MCGRFAQFSIKDFMDIQEEFGIEEKDIPDDLPFNYNCAPGQKIVGFIQKEKRGLKTFRWGLMTDWSVKEHLNLINVRSETLTEKKTFTHYFKQNRCLVIADGFYEWKKEGKQRFPHFIRRKDAKPFAIAGLWNDWTSPEGNTTSSCTLLTTTANPLVAKIHDRMPVILPKERYVEWLDENSFDREKLLSFLTPFPADRMEMYEVSTEVNFVKNNCPELIKPVVLDVLFKDGE